MNLDRAHLKTCWGIIRGGSIPSLVPDRAHKAYRAAQAAVIRTGLDKATKDDPLFKIGAALDYMNHFCVEHKVVRPAAWEMCYLVELAKADLKDRK